MSAQVIDFEQKKQQKERKRRITNLKNKIKELNEIAKSVTDSINCLTKWRTYRYINIRADELFTTYKDVKRNIEINQDLLKTLEIRDCE